MAKLLFLLKKRTITTEEYSSTPTNKPVASGSTYCLSSGLRNSASFVVDMLNQNNIEAKMVEVVDNNCIDREVTAYKPTHVIIEAFWVVPEKFDVLNKLHPKVKWIVRNHSEMPFLANEGIAVNWSLQYLSKKNVYLAPNSKRAYYDTVRMTEAAYGHDMARFKVLYLPNFYKIKEDFSKRHPLGKTIDVGCFGAVRPMKNHLLQAIAAVHFAGKHNKTLRFHINTARIEDAGNNSLKSLRGLFANLDPKKFHLVEHGWLSHDDFLKLVATMDIGLQASFTESFNIVAADFVSKGVPIVVSKEIDWLPKDFWARETSSEDIEEAMERVLYGFGFWNKAKKALKGLHRYNEDSKRIWIRDFKD